MEEGSEDRSGEVIFGSRVDDDCGPWGALSAWDGGGPPW